MRHSSFGVESKNRNQILIKEKFIKELKKGTGQVACDRLLDAGFNNTVLVPKKDLPARSKSQVGYVESISIGDVTEYRRKTIFSPNVRVIIAYHEMKDSSHSKNMIRSVIGKHFLYQKE